ncbi:hypothetical protein JCR33_05260 [Acuticoccus sp. 2012]|uniref:Uncharacterized protein n=2 Tax=Acuticoccus mangrovi TaxID=2796142 RepID=A0A934ILZ6_9HYPH|nr:hypothetical protein [Acuticoccus mangrovi]
MPTTVAAFRTLAIIMWLCEFVSLILPGTVLQTVAELALGGLLLVGLTRIRRWTMAFATGLIVLSACALLAGASIEAGLAQLRQGALVGAFLQTLILLRATVEEHPRLSAIQTRFEAIDSRDRNGGIILVSHLLGSVMTIGVMSVFAPLMRRAKGDQRLQAAELSMRGFSLIAFWSPFTVAMATVNASMPNLPIWQISLAGAVIAFGALGAGYLLGQFRIGARALGEVLKAITPIGLPLLLLTIVTIIVSVAFGLGALRACILVIPPVCLVWSKTMSRKAIANIGRRTIRSLDRLADDITLFTMSLVLAGLVLDVPSLLEALGSLIGEGRPSYVFFVIGAALIAALPMIGIHMILPTTLVLAIFANLSGHSDGADLLMTMLVLVGWCFGSMLSPASVALLTASSMFDVPIERLTWGSNMGFLLGLFTVVALAGWGVYAFLI